MQREAKTLGPEDVLYYKHRTRGIVNWYCWWWKAENWSLVRGMKVTTSFVVAFCLSSDSAGLDGSSVYT